MVASLDASDAKRAAERTEREAKNAVANAKYAADQRDILLEEMNTKLDMLLERSE